MSLIFAFLALCSALFAQTGAVTFMDGETVLGSGTLACNAGTCTATFSTSAMALGTHSITAVYSGDQNYNGSTTPVLLQVVIPPMPIPVLMFPASGTVGVPFSLQLAASNSPTSFQATGLPGGLTLSAAGLLAGTPTVASISDITVSATNAGGTGSAILALTINPAVTPPPVITSFAANPATITAGQSSSLSWTATGATSESIGGTVYTSPIVVTPTQTTTYTLTATGPGGTTTAQTTVTVNPVVAAPIISSFTASPSSITAGASSTLSWSVSGATSLTLNGAAVTGSSIVVEPTSSTNYTLIASGPGGTVSAQSTIMVTPVVPPPPSGTPTLISLSPTSVALGQPVTIAGANLPAVTILWVMSSAGTQGIRVSSPNGTTITFMPTTGIFPQGTVTLYLNGYNSITLSLTITN